MLGDTPVSWPIVRLRRSASSIADLRELAAQLQAIAPVSDVSLSDANLDVQPRREELDLPLQALAPSVSPGTPTYSTRPV